MAESTTKLEPGKIFVGGISWDTTKDTLVNYFSKFGKVTDGVIMVDSVTKMPRGFGFVTFEDHASVSTVIEEEQHYLDGKKIDPKEAITKDYHASSQLSKTTSIAKKVFVGGLPHGCSLDEIKAYFNQFGEVLEVDVKIDRATKKPRGFAFIEYKTQDSARDATKRQFHTFKEKKIEVKPAENRTPGTTATQSTPAVQGAYYSAQTPQYPPTAAQQPQPAYNYAYYGYASSHPSYGAQGAQSYAAAQPSYPSQTSSYQPNGYSQAYNAYPATTPFNSSSQSYPPSGSYSSTYPPTQYPATAAYQGTAETGVAPYANSQSSYYQNAVNTRYPQQPQGDYTSPDSRYPQNQNPRNW